MKSSPLLRSCCFLPLAGLITTAEAAPKILFIRGGNGTVGFLEGGSNEQSADLFNFTTASGNHSWGELGSALLAEGYEIEQMIEGPVVSSVPTPLPLDTMNLNQYAVIVFGSNNADYTPAQVNALHTYVQNGGSALFVSDGNFGQNWGDAPSSDQSFLTFFGMTMNQDLGTYTIDRNPAGRPSEFLVPNHPILNGVNTFDGEGVSPGTLGTPSAGVTSTIITTARNSVRRNTGAAQGPSEPVTTSDGTLITATHGTGRIALHFDRNTFFNLNGAGTNLNRFQNEFYARNLFNWLAGKPNFNVATDNYAPRCHFPNITSGSAVIINNPLTVDVSGKDPDGSVAYVDLFVDDVLVSRDTTAPYQWTLSNLVLGNHVLKATIADNEGKATSTVLPIIGEHTSNLETAISRSGWTLTSSVNNSVTELPLAIDGLANTRWPTRQFQTNGQTLRLDFGQRQLFHRILLESEASPNDYPRGYRVEGSDDDANYTVLITGSGTPSTTSISISPPATYRYVRIVQTGASTVNWWSVHELNVYRPPANTVFPKAAWLQRYFTAAQLANPALQATHWGDQADLDGDGLNTLLEFAFGTAPDNAASHAPLLSSSGTEPSGDRYLDLSFRRWKNFNNISYAIEASTDLTDWTSNGLSTQFIGQPLPNFDGTETVTIRLTPPTGPRHFSRLRVQ